MKPETIVFQQRCFVEKQLLFQSAFLIYYLTYF